MTTAAKNGLLLQFRPTDTLSGVTRETVKRMAEALGFNETQAVHLALARLAKEVLPAYEPDDGPLTQAQFKVIDKLVPQDRVFTKSRSLF